MTAATAAVAGVAALDVIAAERLSPAPATEKTITVNRSPEDLYRFWRDFENFPKFMENLEEVRVTGEGRSTMKRPTSSTR